MQNQIPRRQITQTAPQMQDTNMKGTQARPMNMPEYDMPMPPYRPMETQDRDRDRDLTPTRPSAADAPPTNYTQVEPTPQATPQINFTGAPIGVPVFDPEFTQGYLRQNIGSRVRVEFLIGTNMLTDRTGTLVDVGISYIILLLADTDDLLLCDIYSIKFVTFFR